MASPGYFRISVFLVIIAHLYLFINRDIEENFDKFLTFDCQNYDYDTYLHNITAYCRNNEGDLKCRMENQEIINLLENQQEIAETHFGSMCCHNNFCGFDERKTVCDWKWHKLSGIEREFCERLKNYERMDILDNEKPEQVLRGWGFVVHFVIQDRTMCSGGWLEGFGIFDLIRKETKTEVIQNSYEAKDKYAKIFVLEDEILRAPSYSISKAAEKRMVLKFLEQQWK